MAHRRKRAKRNPSGDAINYWIGLAVLVTGATAIWAWRNMNEQDKAKALPGT